MSNNNKRNFSNTKKNNCRGRKSSAKSNQRRFDKDEDLKSTTNDPSWYSANPALLRDAASIPYSWSTGLTSQLDTPAVASIILPGGRRALAAPEFTAPGICALHLSPAFGWAGAATSPINIAAQEIYSFVRHANSGHSNYDAPDLMVYLLAMSQVYSYINWLMRIYGECTLSSQRNRYLPNNLVKAEGVNYNDVISNLAQFRYGINVLIDKAASFSVPNDMTIFQRHAFLYQNIYTEGTSIKDQLYMYVPFGFYVYVGDQQASSLTLKRIKHNPEDPQSKGMDNLHVKDLLDFGTDMIDQLYYSEDLQIMSGDILKAYGSDKLLKLGALAEQYPIVPIFDLRVLEQFKNATPVLLYPDEKNYAVYADLKQDASKSFLTFDYNIKQYDHDEPANISGYVGMWAFNGAKRIITTTTAEVTPDVTMENTRLTAVSYKQFVNVDAGEMSQHYWCGSEIPMYVTYWRDAKTQSYVDVGMGYCPFDSTLPWTNEHHLAWVTNCFKFAPALSIFNIDETGGALNKFATYVGSSIDIDNYAVIDPETLLRLHEAALLNEFHVNAVNRVG